MHFTNQQSLIISQLIIILGVSGSGKTTVGLELQKALHLPFHDADDYHTNQSIAKMSQGIPLGDQDRLPWLNNLAELLAEWSQTGGAILACSALKESYREILSSKVKDIKWVYLEGSQKLIEERLASRSGHYMKKDMLTSQFEILEPPGYGHHISIAQSSASIIESILTKLESDD